jgi:uncharacterized protein DUF4231
LAVALILALEGVFHYKEQWQNFRGTEQYLLSQKYRFENSADEYQPLSLSREDAFKLMDHMGIGVLAISAGLSLSALFALLLLKARPAAAPVPG